MISGESGALVRFDHRLVGAGRTLSVRHLWAQQGNINGLARRWAARNSRESPSVSSSFLLCLPSSLHSVFSPCSPHLISLTLPTLIFEPPGLSTSPSSSPPLSLSLSLSKGIVVYAPSPCRSLSMTCCCF